MHDVLPAGQPQADAASLPPFAPGMVPPAGVSGPVGPMTLGEALDAIPDDAFMRAPMHGPPDLGVSRLLALDVLETAGCFEIHASVPGIAPESLDITVLGSSVRIAGERRMAETPAATAESDHRWLVRERPVGRFDRTVSLPSHVDPAGAEASVGDGVLIVRLPKQRRPALLRIPVQSERA